MSMVQINIKDETFAGKILNEILITLDNELTTMRAIIKARVYAEVEKYNQHSGEYFRGFVQPNDTEATLNGYKMRSERNVDAEKQFYVACESFMKNGYFVLIDDKQAESLDEEVLVTRDSKISFVKLTPLVGG